MLRSMRIKNLALVEDLSLHFNSGLTAITGETGAGKSILIGALGYLLGERADKSLIRTGEAACTLEAVLDLGPSPALNALFEEQGLEWGDEGLILRRVIKQNGSGQILVNDQSVTLNFLKQLGNLLVDMHGPYDHQSLLHQEEQLALLDAYAPKAAGAMTTYQAAYAELQAVESRQRALQGADGDWEEQLERLRYRVQEIDRAALTEDEEESLVEEHRIQSNASQILESIQQALEYLQQQEGNAFDLLAHAQKALRSAARYMDEAKAWADEAAALSNRLQDLVQDMNHSAGSMEADPTRLHWLDERITIYDRLKRKYGGSVTRVLQSLEEAQSQLNELENRDEEIARLAKEQVQVSKRVTAAGDELSKIRQAAARKLEKSITGHLQNLGFPEGAFAVTLTACDPGPSGMDDIDFGFAPNTGESMRPLRNIASSGEISRVMLASKAVLAAQDQVPVLIFDEIDANVGGEMGHAIGKTMLDVARFHQVLTITHLPQVAAQAQHHLAVSKETVQGRTYTRVTSLSGEERVAEVARMLGGKSGAASAHARELLKDR